MDDTETIDYLVKHNECYKVMYFNKFFREILRWFLLLCAMIVVFQATALMFGYEKTDEVAPMDNAILVVSSLILYAFYTILKAHYEAKDEVFFYKELDDGLEQFKQQHEGG